MRVAVLGHVDWVEFVRVERLPRAGDILHAKDWWEGPAGGGSVAAVQLHRLAGACTFFTALGSDALGDRALVELEALGPRVEAARRDAPTRRVMTFVEGTGERTITTLDRRLDPSAQDPFPWAELASADAVYVCAADAAALRLARQARVVVATSRVMRLLSEADVRLDAVVGSGSDPAEAFLPGGLTEPPALVVSTEGDRGGSYRTADGRRGRFEVVPPPGPIVDTYGSGDCFAAGLAFGIAVGLPAAGALALAARCGAWCVAGRGPYGSMLGRSDL